MGKVILEDVESSDTKKVDSQGRLYLGKRFAGKEVSYYIEEVEDGDSGQ